ncbi:ABC transporter permease subunit, partial [Hungatella sp. SL.1.14]|uniref:carbohydrate ABC transporter permease n=1 Tax=Hungatella sp. SL.1.14 TaxID=2963703 RepID=UPI00210A546B
SGKTTIGDVKMVTEMFLSGLQTIGEQYYTAAKVDGAKPAKILFRITLPLLSPTIALVLIINIINTSKVFNEVFALFNGKPGPILLLTPGKDRSCMSEG